MSLLPETVTPILLTDRVLPAEVLVAGGEARPQGPPIVAAPASLDRGEAAPAVAAPPSATLDSAPAAAPPLTASVPAAPAEALVADSAAPPGGAPQAVSAPAAPADALSADALPTSDEGAGVQPAASVPETAPTGATRPFDLPPEDAFPSLAELDAILAAHAGPPPVPDAATRAEAAAWLGLDPAIAGDAALFNEVVAALPAQDADAALNHWLGAEAAFALAWTGVPPDSPWP